MAKKNKFTVQQVKDMIGINTRNSDRTVFVKHGNSKTRVFTTVPVRSYFCDIVTDKNGRKILQYDCGAAKAFLKIPVSDIQEIKPSGIVVDAPQKPVDHGVTIDAENCTIIVPQGWKIAVKKPSMTRAEFNAKFVKLVGSMGSSSSYSLCEFVKEVRRVFSVDLPLEDSRTFPKTLAALTSKIDIVD